MKTMNLPRLLTTVALAGVLGLASPAPAQEQTGKIIEKLVVSVDEQLSALEKLTEKSAPEKERLKTELDAQLKQFDETTNAVAKAAVRGELVNVYGRINAIDRSEIGETLKTVVQVSDTLRKLEAAMQTSPQLNPTTLKEQQERIGSFVRNTARLVKAVDQMDATGKSSGSTATLKNSLMMLHQQAKDPVTGVGGAMTRIKDTARALDDIAVQLHILQGVLENERGMLLAAAYVQTVDLPLLRLARARLGAENVVDIPVNKHNEIVERVRRSWKQMSDSSNTLLGSSQASDRLAFDLIASDELDDAK